MQDFWLVLYPHSYHDCQVVLKKCIFICIQEVEVSHLLFYSQNQGPESKCQNCAEFPVWDTLFLIFIIIIIIFSD